MPELEIWKYRVIGYTSNGSVVVTILCDLNDTEKAHDDVMATDKVTLVSTQGPFRYRRWTEDE